MDPDVAIVAIRELFDRAGIGPVEANATADNTGQVLWDEFVQIHRRRFGTHDESD
jgi:hypothetical protein